MKYTKLIKPGTTKTQMVESDRVDFYRQYGWEPEIQEEVTAVLRPRKKTAKAEPAVEDVSSQEEVGTQDELKGD